MNLDVVTDIVELCALKGIRQVVICPGSRSAPLTIAFVRNKKIKCHTFSDERSAAFIALGMAQQTHSPVALVCTSGSAAYNFAPAVAEAFFQSVPLIVFTADRPQEWIDQLDGQTIRQKELYGDHVKKYFELPQDFAHADSVWHANRMVNDAINLAVNKKGPVHINAPFREPLYPKIADNYSPKEVRVIDVIKSENTLSSTEWELISKEINRHKKILIVAGQQDGDKILLKTISEFTSTYGWAFTGDLLGNFHSVSSYCLHSDTFLGQASAETKETLQPDLLITFGRSLVSKSLKIFLRQYRPKEHWHLQTDGEVADTFQSLTRVIRVTANEFFSQLSTSLKKEKSWDEYQANWTEAEKSVSKKITSFFKSNNEGEFAFVNKVLSSLPEHCNLHLSNSMTVRYTNHIGLSLPQKSVNVFCNRGTSGIDGCSSTAVGHALMSSIPNILITGDLAFFYDRNAFWHNYPIPNLFIVVLNNHGGIIFNLIDGPSDLPEAKEFFITEQKLKAKAVAEEFGFSFSDSSVNLDDFFTSNGAVKILEFDSSQETNKHIFEDFRKQIK